MRPSPGQNDPRLEVLMIVTVLGKVAVGAWTREPAAR
jgi:hypothetical protein